MEAYPNAEGAFPVIHVKAGWREGFHSLRRGSPGSFIPMYTHLFIPIMLIYTHLGSFELIQTDLCSFKLFWAH